MIETFWIKLVLSFIVGSLWVTLTTVLAERYGSKIGGWIGGLPSTVLIGLFFIGYIQGTEIAAQATNIIPIIVGFNGIFLILYASLIKRSFILALIVSLIAWFVLSGIIIIYNVENFLFSVIGWILLVFISYYIFENLLKVKSYEKIIIEYSFSQLFLRTLFGGVVISFAVFMSKLAGPIYGGIFSAFPAMFLSTLIITYYARGQEFSVAIAKSLMISGLINVTIYAIAVKYTYIYFGLMLGTILACIITVISGYITYTFIQKKLI
ncbi:hypothetical protein COV16_04280 [Candidatus Woesearchaeota archaeon CG10_big_fil_rev_8_21_14_0_10_34_8]|nr:MAG: hypothetical protein COV16_04280 [Candidatus Woesearchaeota archaeon CG10_big_fil_rev_8_21_14_0_10_34_8]